MEAFKKFHNIDKEITLASKTENGHLFVLFNEKWIRLNLKRNKDKFYSIYTLNHRYGIAFNHALNMERKKIPYNPEYYKQNPEIFRKASLKWSLKKQQ